MLTLGEARRVVVHVREGDADSRGPREAAHLSGHVFSLDHDLVVFLDFPVHAGQRRLDEAWGGGNMHLVKSVDSKDSVLLVLLFYCITLKISPSVIGNL